MDLIVVERVAVVIMIVISKPLAVISDESDDGAIPCLLYTSDAADE